MAYTRKRGVSKNKKRGTRGGWKPRAHSSKKKRNQKSRTVKPNPITLTLS